MPKLFSFFPTATEKYCPLISPKENLSHGSPCSKSSSIFKCPLLSGLLSLICPVESYRLSGWIVELTTSCDNCDTPSTKSLAVATSVGELFIVLVPTGGDRTLTVVVNTSLTISKLDADLMFVLAASMVSEGVALRISAPSTTLFKLDNVFLFTPSWEGSVLHLVLLSPREIGDRDTAVF
jgi:hypothetical protein